MNISSHQNTIEDKNNLVWSIIAAIFCRLLLNTARRFAYPFAPVLSRGLGVSLTSITSLIAINQATAILGIGIGPFTDRFGYRKMILISMGMLSLGMLAAGLFPGYYSVLGALFLAGLGKTIFDPAIQAYISRRVPYKKRGTAIGFLEMSWAGSTLIGIPCIALLMSLLNWQAPFYILGGLALLGIVLLLILFEKSDGKDVQAKSNSDIWQALPHLIKNRAALSALAYAFLISVANDNLFVVYGAWLEKSFDVSIVVLGVGTGVIGLSELCGEGLTVLLSDRIGLRKSVLIGLLLTSINYLLMPFYAQSLLLSLSGIFIVFLTFEFTIVTSMSFSTEIIPIYRATMMSAFFAAAGAGRVLGALIGGHIWLAGGIVLTGMVSAATTFLAFIILIRGTRG